MRTVGSRVAAASATFLALLGLTAGSAQGDRIVETIYAEPTAYVVPSSYTTSSYVVPTGTSYVYPTSYVASSSRVVSTSDSYVVPTSTSYVLPASYATTAYSYLPSYYVAPTTYYTPTVYRRAGLFRRSLRPVYETTRSYAYDLTPTTYYQPTTIAYSSPLVASSATYGSGCVEASVPFNPPPPANTSAIITDPNPPQKSITSSPSAGSPKEPPEPALNNVVPEKSRVVPKETLKDPVPSGPVSPPEGPAPDKDQPPVVAPAEPPPSNGPGASATPTERKDFRPRFTELKSTPTSAAQNFLRGEVVDGVSGKVLPNVDVIFTDMKGNYPDKKRKTDAKGAFEVYLPNGGWAVSVVDPNAIGGTKPREYGQITSTGGRYLDDTDSPIYGLRLSH